MHYQTGRSFVRDEISSGLKWLMILRVTRSWHSCSRSNALHEEVHFMKVSESNLKKQRGSVGQNCYISSIVRSLLPSMLIAVIFGTESSQRLEIAREVTGVDESYGEHDLLNRDSTLVEEPFCFIKSNALYEMAWWDTHYIFE